MPVLTANEAAVLDTIRRIRSSGAIAVHVIRSKALDERGVRYDSVNRALNGLIAHGLVVKPQRGYYQEAQNGSS